MRLTNSAFKLLVSAAVLCLPLAAHADTFSWSVIAAGITGSGTFTATPSVTLPSAQNITGITGSLNGSAVTLLVPATYDPVTPSHFSFPDGVYFNYDNIVYTSGPTFDFHGLLFKLANGIYVNLFNVGSLSQVVMLNGDPIFDAANVNAANATIAAAPLPVPEPSTLLLLGTGLLSLSANLRRKAL